MRNNKKFLYLELGSLVFCLVFCTINHFLYEWWNNTIFIAPFVPINESVWEHGKLLFMPFLFFSVIEYFFIENKVNYVFAKSLALIVCIPLMLVIFYTYTGIIGNHYLIADIALSLVIVLFINISSYKVTLLEKNINANWIVIFAIIIFILLVVFTFCPPRINLFLDSLTGKYGIYF